MTNRTLQFLGAAYGNSDVTITAIIDNVVVYNNTVITTDEEIPLPEDLGNSVVFPTLFSVENSDQFPVEFSGARTMSLTVTGGEGILLTNVLCNYMEQISNIGNTIIRNPGTATVFSSCYFYSTPVNSEGTPDCRSSVALNGNVQVPDIVPASQGIWTWEVNNGDTLVCNLNVSLGNVA
tara:strand:- start:84 stop:620 length:537 start_codon:yes stop_codon:yes gene_type:complete